VEMRIYERDDENGRRRRRKRRSWGRVFLL